MRALVTGGSGFTGRHVVSELVRRGHDVVALARSSVAAQKVSELGADPIGGDLDEPESLDEAFALAKADVLVNVASMGFGHAPAVVAAAEEAGIERGVFVSTTAVFTTLPASSKAVRLAAEEAVNTSAMDTVIVRPTMIYGAPGDRNMERLLRLLRRTRVLPMPGRGDRLQQPVHVEDLAQAIATAAERVGSVTGAYDVAGPEPLTFRQVVEQAAAAAGRSVRLVPVPLAPVRLAVAVQERLLPEPVLKVEQIDRLNEDKAFDITAARRDLDFAPRSFADGIVQEARACFP